MFAPLVALRAQTSNGNYPTPYTFTTLAGWPPGPGSADGAGNIARFCWPEGVAVDVAGNVYVADTGNETIRKITVAGEVTTIAGAAGSWGSSDGAGSAARFYGPYAIAVDVSGNLYVADGGNKTIRKITPTGVAATLAGTAGSVGSADGTGSAARFSALNGLAVDGSGNLYVADAGAIRKITPAGEVTTLAGIADTSGSTDATGSDARFYGPLGVAVDEGGNVYVGDSGNNTIRKIASNGVVTTIAGTAGVVGSADGIGSAAQFIRPSGVAVDGSGNIYVSDNQMIREIKPGGAVTTRAGSAYNSGSADGTGSAAQFNWPSGIAVDGTGNVYVADSGNSAIRKITPANGVATLAGGTASSGSADGAGAAARFAEPSAVVADGTGNLYVADTDNSTIRKITANGVVTTIAGSTGSRGSADGTGSSAQFNGPYGIAVDASGNVYVADTGNKTVRKITAEGTVITLAGCAGSPGSVDGTGSTARFDDPRGVEVDGAGNVYVSDYADSTIRKITADGVVTTFAGSAGSAGFADGLGTAAEFFFPAGVAVDTSGNVYVADMINGAIRKITPEGLVTTIVGTPPGSVAPHLVVSGLPQLFFPSGVAVDGSGNIFLAEWMTSLIWKVPPGGQPTPIAGQWPQSIGVPPGSADGTGKDAEFAEPFGIAVDGAGYVYVADTFNNTIRRGLMAPLAAVQPLPQTVTDGDRASFTFVVNGGGNLTYQWQVSTNGGGSWTNLADDSVYSGTTSATLSILQATPELGDLDYRCVATNGVSPVVTSQAAQLRVGLANLEFLQTVFHDVMGRYIDPGGASAFGAALAGGRTQAEVLADLLGSTEYGLRQIEPVIRLYHAALGRSPDYAGLWNWSSALQAGALTLAGAADQFAGSAEFLSRFGTMDNTQFVQLLYRNVLGRDADPAGQADWVGRLNAGASRGTVVIGFSQSEESKRSMAQPVEIEQLYFLLLHRMPTATELRSWQDFLLGGDQTDSLYAEAFPSGLIDPSYVQQVFRGFLRREVDSEALDAYGNALAAGAITHSGIVAELLNSAEFNQNVAPVMRLYLGALQRMPDPNMNDWVTAMRTSTSLAAMVATFAGSQEFSDRYGAFSNRDYVKQLYTNILGREADPAGLDGWTASLDSGGATRALVLLGISESQEAVNRFAPTVRTVLHYFTFLNSAPTQADLDYWTNYLATLADQMQADLLLSPAFTNGG